MSRTELVLVRHGETEWSRDKRHTGWTDIDLTDVGRHQAGAARAPLSRMEFSRVLVSTLHRARETCRLAGFADRAELNPDLREWHYGAYEGRTTDEIREERPGWVIWDDGVENGEAIETVAARAERVIAATAGTPGRVLLVAHGHLLRVLAARWIGLPSRTARHFFLGPASISILGHEREEPALLCWNEESHLQDAAPPDHA